MNFHPRAGVCLNTMRTLGWFRLYILCIAASVPALPASAADPFLRRTAAVEVVERVGPAVVNITTERVVEQPNPFGDLSLNPFFDRFFEELFEPHLSQSVQSLGSGVLIDSKGHVLTNEHVIERATRIRVTLGDRREFGASLIGADPNTDLAVLKVETEESLPWIAPGSSSDLMVGEPVIAIGNPFGLSSTVTTGVISARDRSLRTDNRVYHGFLQTDAAINPGNSGGPLLNAEGKLIGINTAIYGGGAQGIGFAIPIDAAKRVVTELIEHGSLTPVWLGLEVQDLDPSLTQVLELPRGLLGALVTRVAPKSPAQSGGVQRGDLITKVESVEVQRARDFHEVLQGATVQQKLRLQIWRDGTARPVELVAAPIPEGLVEELSFQLLGLELKPHNQGGFAVVRVRPGSGAAQIGVQPGDLLLRINGLPLDDAEALQRSVLDLRGRTRALLVVQRGAGRYHVSVPLV